MDDFWHVLLALGSAVVCGGLIGLERELHGRWAGLRTHMMVAMGAAVFVLAVSPQTGSEVARIIQGVAAGVGFIGAGTILKLTDKLEVKGLTTASSIWLAAAVGTASGTGYFLLAGAATVLTVIVLAVLGWIERNLEPGKHGPAADREDHTSESH